MFHAGGTHRMRITLRQFFMILKRKVNKDRNKERKKVSKRESMKKKETLIRRD